MGLFQKGLLTKQFAIAAAATLAAVTAPAIADPGIPGVSPPKSRSAHIEAVTQAQQKDLSFKHHGRAASEISAWRARREGLAASVPHLVDLDPYDLGWALQYHLNDNRIVSISSMSFGDMQLPDALSLENFWSKNDTLVVLPAGNDGNEIANINYEPDTIAHDRNSVYLRSDTMIRVGAIKNGAVAPYTSQGNPDFLFANAFDEGFCALYYMNKQEMDALRAALPPSVVQSIEGQRSIVGDLLAPHPEADKPVCNLGGTSFVTPNLSGYLLSYAHAKPLLSNYDLTVTALLSATHDKYTLGPTKANAQGFRFNAIAGLGALDVARHASMIARLESERAALGETAPAQAQRARAVITTGATEAEIADNLCISDTLVEMRIAATANDPKVILPTEATLTSPAGTVVTMKLKRDKWQATPDGRYRLAADASYFLGEEAKGKWSLAFAAAGKAAPLSTYRVESFEVAHWGTDCNSALGRTMKFAAGR